MKTKFKGVLGIVLLATIFFGTFIAGSIYKLSTVGFISGYQGLQSYFDAVKFRNYWYDMDHRGPNPSYVLMHPTQYGKTEPQIASVAEFFDRLNLDPDYGDQYLPNLCASQTPVTVDTTSEPKIWQWKVPERTEEVSGSNATHTWMKTFEIYREYQMMRYRCEWSINLWLAGPAGEAYPDTNRAWHDAEIWIKLEPTAFIYFQDNPDQVFFSPALIQLQNIEWFSYKTSKDTEARDFSISQYEDLIPKAEGETLGIYYNKGGAPTGDMEQSYLSYQGKTLDPKIFRNAYWIKLSLLEYKPFSWFEWGGLAGWGWKYPSVKMKFLVHVFVIGQWTVRLEKGDIVELKVHETISPPPQSVDINRFLRAIKEFFDDPWNKMFMAIVVLLVCVAAILYFTPAGTGLAVYMIRRVGAKKREVKK